MTKSTSKKVTCASCGETYFAKKPHTCDLAKVRSGQVTSEPQRARSRKMMFGRHK